jgi:hypothetical protein
MRRIFAIAGLTWKAAFRYRLFWVMATLLILAVVGLPLVIKGDGTAQGLTQVLITYTLGATATLLGFFTLWFSCGTLARDIEESQMQTVCVKPVGRWQVWIGKWMGIMALNGMLLGIAGTLDFVLLQYRASKLPPAQQKLLQEQVFVARAGAKEKPPDLKAMVDGAVAEWHKKNKNQNLSIEDETELRKTYTAQARAYFEEVDPGSWKKVPWGIDLSRLPEKTRHQPLEIRIKFHTAAMNPAETYAMRWIIEGPDLKQPLQMVETFPPDSYQNFQIPADVLGPKAQLALQVYNPNEETLTFPLEDGFEILYYENTFAVNFARGLLVILCWMGFLSMVGLATASELSFPVAAFASVSVLIMGLFSGTLSTIVEQNTIFGFNARTSEYNHTALDNIVVPMFKGALTVINLVQGFSPIDSLSTGRSVTWGELGLAFAQIILLLGGFFAILGIVLFMRRELAAAQTG